MMLLIAVILCPFFAPYVHAQPSGHIPATLAALEAFPSFFHRLEVVVLAKAEGDLEEVFVTDGERRIRVLNIVPPLDADPKLLEIAGTYWDVASGRTTPDWSTTEFHSYLNAY